MLVMRRAGQKWMDFRSALPYFFIIVIVTSGVKRRSSLTTKLAIIRDWGCPQQAGFANLAGGLVYGNGASVYTGAQLASMIYYWSFDSFGFSESIEVIRV